MAKDSAAIRYTHCTAPSITNYCLSSPVFRKRHKLVRKNTKGSGGRGGRVGHRGTGVGAHGEDQASGRRVRGHGRRRPHARVHGQTLGHVFAAADPYPQDHCGGHVPRRQRRDVQSRHEAQQRGPRKKKEDHIRLCAAWCAKYKEYIKIKPCTPPTAGTPRTAPRRCATSSGYATTSTRSRTKTSSSGKTRTKPPSLAL